MSLIKVTRNQTNLVNFMGFKNLFRRPVPQIKKVSIRPYKDTEEELYLIKNGKDITLIRLQKNN